MTKAQQIIDDYRAGAPNAIRLNNLIFRHTRDADEMHRVRIQVIQLLGISYPAGSKR